MLVPLLLFQFAARWPVGGDTRSRAALLPFAFLRNPECCLVRHEVVIVTSFQSEFPIQETCYVTEGMERTVKRKTLGGVELPVGTPVSLSQAESSVGPVPGDSTLAPTLPVRHGLPSLF